MQKQQHSAKPARVIRGNVNGKAKPTGRILPAKPAQAAPRFTVIGHGIRQAFDGDLLVLVIDCSEAAYAKAPMSASGKNRLLGSTQGTHYLSAPMGGDNIGIGLNVFRK